MEGLECHCQSSVGDGGMCETTITDSFQPRVRMSVKEGRGGEAVGRAAIYRKAEEIQEKGPKDRMVPKGWMKKACQDPSGRMRPGTRIRGLCMRGPGSSTRSSWCFRNGNNWQHWEKKIHFHIKMDFWHVVLKVTRLHDTGSTVQIAISCSSWEPLPSWRQRRVSPPPTSPLNVVSWHLWTFRLSSLLTRLEFQVGRAKRLAPLTKPGIRKTRS